MIIFGQRDHLRPDHLRVPTPCLGGGRSPLAARLRNLAPCTC